MTHQELSLTVFTSPDVANLTNPLLRAQQRPWQCMRRRLGGHQELAQWLAQ